MDESRPTKLPRPRNQVTAPAACPEPHGSGQTVPTPALTLNGQTQCWLRDAKAGGQQEFSRLYEHIAPAVFAWASLRLRRDRRTELDPQDLVQEVWLRAWRSLEQFDAERTPFRRWIFRVAKLVMLELVRDGARQRYAHMGSDTKRAILDEFPDPITRISERLARADSLRVFLEQVAELPEDEAKLVTYCGLEGLTYTEVALRMDSTEGAIARRWQRLRLRLNEGALPQHLFVAIGRETGLTQT